VSPIVKSRLADLRRLVLRHGGHPNAAAGMCAMEAVAFVAGEPHSDKPKCACPVISAVMRRLNDRIPTDELRTELLRPLVRKLVGTKSTRDVEIARGYVAADFACRVFAPIALEARGYKADAEKCRALPRIESRSSALTARDMIRSLPAAAYAAAVAAYAAAAAADAVAAYAAAVAADAAAAAYAYADAAYAAAAADAVAAAARRRVFEEGVRMIGAMLATKAKR
jgi:hypothetical protein